MGSDFLPSPFFLVVGALSQAPSAPPRALSCRVSLASGRPHGSRPLERAPGASKVGCGRSLIPAGNLGPCLRLNNTRGQRHPGSAEGSRAWQELRWRGKGGNAGTSRVGRSSGTEMSFKAVGTRSASVSERSPSSFLSLTVLTPLPATEGTLTRACFLPSPPPCPAPLLPVNAENSSSDQRQACKKHELYVSFRDLGWQVRAVGWVCRMAGGALGWASPRLPHQGGEGRVRPVRWVRFLTYST